MADAAQLLADVRHVRPVGKRYYLPFFIPDIRIPLRLAVRSPSAAYGSEKFLKIFCIPVMKVRCRNLDSPPAAYSTRYKGTGTVHR